MGGTVVAGAVEANLPRDPYAYHQLQVTAEHPEAISTNSADHVLLDFGKDAVGWFEFADGPAGEYEIVLGELTNAQGSVAMEYPKSNIRLAKVTGEKGAGLFRVPLPPDKFNLKGYDPKAPAILLPNTIGTVMPFRFVELVKSPVLPVPSAFNRRMVSYPIDLSRSSFTSCDDALNRVYDFCKYSIKATSFCGCYVDGDRERTPYEADAYINQLAHYAIDNDYSLARFSHEWLMEHPTWPTEWKQHSIMIAWADWMWTGDTRSLAKYYDRLVNEKLNAGWTVREDGLMVTSGDVKRGPRDIVDWPPVERDGFVLTPVNAVVNAFRHRNLRELADIARALGKDDDARRFAQSAEALKTVYHRVFFNAATGLYVDGEGVGHSSLHANAAALAFGLVPEQCKAKVLDFLERKGMACSVYFSQYLLEAFFLNDRPEAALKLITAKGDRGWLGMMDFGSTVTMEAWNVAAKPNLDLNHAWSATPLSMISRFILGVTPLEPGFRKLRIAPMTCGLKKYSGVIPVATGSVKVAVDGDRLTVDSPAPAEVVWQGRTYTQAAGHGEYPSRPHPWSHLDFNDAPEDFHFVVIPDRGGGDYRGAFTNALKCADMMHPAFVITVGDEVNGFKRVYPLIAKEKDDLTNKTAVVRAPFFHVVGNHDINISMPGPYSNAYEVTQQVWRDYFGPSEYYSFIYKNCLFLVLNSMEQYRDITKRPTNGISAEQYAWAAKELAKYPNVRWTFLFNHHPSEWLSKAWNDFERANLADRKYTVFGGDWHTYFHAKRRGHDYYALSVAGGVGNMAYVHQQPDRAKLMGPEYGEMDHITYVTMAKDGPEVVNLLLEGILPGDYLNRENSKDDTMASVLDDPPSAKAKAIAREISEKLAAEKAARAKKAGK